MLRKVTFGPGLMYTWLDPSDQAYSPWFSSAENATLGDVRHIEGKSFYVCAVHRRKGAFISRYTCYWVPTGSRNNIAIKLFLEKL